MRFPTDEFYFKSEAEMAQIFSAIPQALTNTVAIAERCQVKLKLGQVLLPKFPVPEGLSAEAYLERLCWEGLIRRYQQAAACARTVTV